MNQLISLILKTSITDYFQQLIDWMLQFLRITGLSFSFFFVLAIAFWIFYRGILALLADMVPILKGFIAITEYLFFPGALMKCVWRVFALKRLSITTEQRVSFSWGWTRIAISVEQPLKSVREGFFFFYAPLLNIPVIIAWTFLAGMLFNWLGTISDSVLFYWLWLYVLVSLVLTGLPELPDLFGPFQITVVKTPEFYIFLIYLILISSATLVFWGWGLTLIFSLVYSIFALYEVEKISRMETKRLAKEFDKMFTQIKREPVFLIDPRD
jgi:hypothetical protein